MQSPTLTGRRKPLGSSKTSAICVTAAERRKFCSFICPRQYPRNVRSERPPPVSPADRLKRYNRLEPPVITVWIKSISVDFPDVFWPRIALLPEMSRSSRPNRCHCTRTIRLSCIILRAPHADRSPLHRRRESPGAREAAPDATGTGRRPPLRQGPEW
ncbi:hypothetical protein D3C72_1849030 [compost metagenome]